MSITGEAVMQTLQRERMAIWDTYPTEQARQHAWDQRRTQIVSYLFNEHTTPRSTPSTAEQSMLPSLDVGTGDCRLTFDAFEDMSILTGIERQHTGAGPKPTTVRKPARCFDCHG